MYIKRLFLLLILISFFNGCLYSCNYAPKGTDGLKSTDPCTTDNKAGSTLLRFIDIKGENNKMNIQMEMLLPCQGLGSGSATSEAFSLEFYNADNIIQPKDLTHIISSFASNHNSTLCKDPEKNIELLKAYQNDSADFYTLFEQAAINFSVGLKHSNRLYPFYVKVPVSTNFDFTDPDHPIIKGIGKPNIKNDGLTGPYGACVEGADMSPFIQNEQTLSPVNDVDGSGITSEDKELPFLLSLYSYQLIGYRGPFSTYAVLKKPAGSNQGIKSIPGYRNKGSYFNFSINIKPGNYKVVLAKIGSVTDTAFKGDYSVSQAKVYNNSAASSKKYLDYLQDCNKDVSCGTTVKVN